MARVEIDYVWQSVTGQAIDGGSVQIYQRGTTTPVTVYTGETGSGTYALPLTTVDGRVEGWVAPGSYDIVASKTGFLSVTQPWDAVAYTPPGDDIHHLSATLPSKIVWEDGGGNPVVELYGQITPAGLVVANQDTFATDTTASYQRVEGGAVGTLIVWNSGAGRMDVNNTDSTAHRFFRSDWIADSVDLEYTIRGVANMNAFSATQKFGVGFFNAANESVEFFAQSDMWGQGQLVVNGTTRATAGTNAGGATNSFPNNVAGPLTNIPGWLRIKRTTNSIVGEIWRNDPALGGSPSGTVTYLMSGPEQVKFGSGVAVRPLVIEQHPNTDPMWFDDFTQSSVQPEAHDFFVAITPTTGPRTVRRIFGSLGGAFRTDL